MSDSIGGSSSAQSRLSAFAAAAAITVSEEIDDNFDPDIGSNIDNLVWTLNNDFTESESIIEKNCRVWLISQPLLVARLNIFKTLSPISQTRTVCRGWVTLGFSKSLKSLKFLSSLQDDFSIFENMDGLSDDMRFLASMPELCDVTFLVGDTREPVCAVKAVLAARSKYA